VNTFIDENGAHIQPAQLVTRKTERSNALFYLVGTLLEDFTNEHGRPLNSGFNIAKANQTWVTDSAGRYKSFNANLDIGDHELPSRDR